MQQKFLGIMAGLLFCAGALEAEIRSKIERSFDTTDNYKSKIYVLTLQDTLRITAKKNRERDKALSPLFEVLVTTKRNNMFNQEVTTKNVDSSVVYEHLRKLCNNDAKVEIAPDWLQALCLKNGLSEK